MSKKKQGIVSEFKHIIGLMDEIVDETVLVERLESR